MTQTEKAVDRGDAGEQVPLRAAAAQIAAEQSDLWRAFEQLGETAAQAGPLDAPSRHLVHLAFAISAGSEGATHSHVRRALAAGLSADALEHVALLAVTTLGWPQAVKGLTWIRDITRPDGRAR